MREKVMSFVQGKFVYQEPKIIVTPSKLQMQVTEGGEASAILRVANETHTKMKGFGAVDEFHFDFLPVFDGKENEVTVTVKAGKKKAGEIMKGNLVLITDCGECQVPYEVTVVGRYLEGNEGPITSYEEFVSYAEQDFEGAVTVFYHEHFRDIYLKELKDKRLYQHLTTKNAKKQGLEEFLVSHGDKKPMLFVANRGKVSLDVEEADGKFEIVVARDSWGYMGIKVSTDCPYLMLDKEVLEPTDFVDNQGKICVTVPVQGMLPGVHRGKIVLETIYQRVEIGVTVHDIRGMKEREEARRKKKIVAELVKAHIEYLIRPDMAPKLIQGLQQVCQSQSLSEYQLQLTGYLSILVRNQEAMKTYVDMVEGMTAPEYGETWEKVLKYLECTYIKTRINNNKDGTKAFCDTIKGYYENGYRHVKLLVMLERLGYYRESSRALLAEIETLWKEGCFSPYLHCYRMKLILQEPSLVKRLTPAMVGTLKFGLKHNLIKDEMVVAISFLAGKERRFTPGLLGVLEACYEKTQNKDTLYSICALLIRSERQAPRYHRWFELGVQNRLRITELFEYYMYTLDRGKFGDVLTEVITYFQYENHLRDSVKAQFYACIVENRNQHPQYYAVHENAIAEFAEIQLKNHRITKELAVIYEAVWNPTNIREVAKDMAQVLFVHQLTCSNPNMERVVVVHDEGGGEMAYNLTNGEAQILIATPNVTLYFVDKHGYYHGSTIPYQLEKMLNLDFAAEKCFENGADQDMMLLHMFSNALSQKKVGTREALILHMQIRNQVPGMEYQGKALLALYDYYKSIGEDDLLEEVLQEMDFEAIPSERYPGILQTMIQHKMNDRALDVLRTYEILNCTKKLLLLLITWKLEESDGSFDPFCMRLCDYLYRAGIKNSTTLAYLIHYYMGPTKHLYEIYCAGEKSGVDIKDGGSERVLGQALFVSDVPEQYEKLYLDYYDYGANRILVKAFTAYSAYQYLVGKSGMGDEVRQKIQKEALSEENTVMVLAMLKYYSQREGKEGEPYYTQQEREYIEYQLSRTVSKGQLMTFMKDFQGKVKVPFEIEHSEMIQVFASCEKEPNVEIEIEGQTICASMKQVVPHVYSYELLLFHGETAKYRIVMPGEVQPWKIGTLSSQKRMVAKEAAFCQMLDDMIQAKEQGDVDRYQILCKEYTDKKAVAKKFFSPR